MRYASLAFAHLLCVTFRIQAAIINVPADHPTIEIAIDAAQNGDEIVVAPGEYVPYNGINVYKRLTIRSTFDGSDWTSVKNTILKAPGTLIAMVVQVDGTVIRGFTITRDPIVQPPNTYVGAFGIIGTGVNANIEYNIIENHAHLPGFPAPGPTVGAAISNINGVIQNNIIRNNRATGGGAALSQCDGIIRNNVMYNNLTGLRACPISPFMRRQPDFAGGNCGFSFPAPVGGASG